MEFGLNTVSFQCLAAGSSEVMRLRCEPVPNQGKLGKKVL